MRKDCYHILLKAVQGRRLEGDSRRVMGWELTSNCNFCTLLLVFVSTVVHRYAELDCQEIEGNILFVRDLRLYKIYEGDPKRRILLQSSIGEGGFCTVPTTWKEIPVVCIPLTVVFEEDRMGRRNWAFVAHEGIRNSPITYNVYIYKKYSYVFENSYK